MKKFAVSYITQDNEDHKINHYLVITESISDNEAIGAICKEFFESGKQNDCKIISILSIAVEG